VGTDFILFQQFSACLKLIGRRFPIHVENLIDRTDISFRITVTI
jgi:hypothetical protein